MISKLEVLADLRPSSDIDIIQRFGLSDDQLDELIEELHYFDTVEILLRKDGHSLLGLRLDKDGVSIVFEIGPFKLSVLLDEISRVEQIVEIGQTEKINMAMYETISMFSM